MSEHKEKFVRFIYSEKKKLIKKRNELFNYVQEIYKNEIVKDVEDFFAKYNLKLYAPSFIFNNDDSYGYYFFQSFNAFVRHKDRENREVNLKLFDFRHCNNSFLDDFSKSINTPLYEAEVVEALKEYDIKTYKEYIEYTEKIHKEIYKISTKDFFQVFKGKIERELEQIKELNDRIGALETLDNLTGEPLTYIKEYLNKGY